MNVLILVTLSLPALTGLALRWLPRRRAERAAQAGASVTLVLAVVQALRHHLGGAPVSFEAFSAPWSGEPVFGIDALSAALIPFYALVGWLVIVTTPRRSYSRRSIATLLLVESSVLGIYASRDVVVMALLWLLSAVPALVELRRSDAEARPRRSMLTAGLPLVGSGLLMAVAVALLVAHAAALGVPHPTTLSALQHAGGGTLSFGLLLAAALMRKGVIPFHSWLPPLFERGPLGLAVMLFNAHLGAFLVARLVIAVFPGLSVDAGTLVTAIALTTALYAALVATAQTSPRRLLGFVAMSQASFVLVGLESFNDEGVAGGLVLWLSVALASTATVVAYRATEARAGLVSLGRHHGLATRMPRLAAAFAIFGLAMVGLPGTLGFPAEDLLIHGVLESHPALGVLLVLAAGLNAVNILRVFARLFLGRPARSVAAYPDLTRREGWAFGLAVVLIVGGGLAPESVIASRRQAAQAIAAHTPLTWKETN